MNNLLLTIALGSVCILQSCCKDKESKITTTYELSEEMMAYFVNYEVGTKWIYQDTIDKNNFDTIELISKKSSNVENGDILQKGFELYYKPKKSKDFKVVVSAGINNTYYVKVDPMVTATGAIIFENNDGNWRTGVTYYDSVEITGSKYYNVIKSESTNTFHYLMHVSQNVGIVYFMQLKGGAIYGCFKLINTLKP